MLINSDQEEELPLGSNGFSVTGHHVILPHLRVQLKPVRIGAL